MPTQGERQNFLWRPNDNSSTTLTRYDQEAEHWTRAFKSAQRQHYPGDPIDFGGTFTIIGLLLSLTINLLMIVVILITNFLNWAFNSSNKKRADHVVIETFVDNTDQVKKVEKILQNRPSVFTSERHKLFKKAARAIIIRQDVSFSQLMYELKIDFSTLSKLIDQLYDAGIISGPNQKGKRKVYVSDNDTLDLLFKMEKNYAL